MNRGAKLIAIAGVFFGPMGAVSLIAAPGDSNANLWVRQSCSEIPAFTKDGKTAHYRGTYAQHQEMKTFLFADDCPVYIDLNDLPGSGVI